MNIYVHSISRFILFSSKVPRGTLMMQVAEGIINDRYQWGEKVPAFAIHYPWGCTSSEPPAPAGRMLPDRTKGIGARKSGEAWNLCWNYGPSTKVSSARQLEATFSAVSELGFFLKLYKQLQKHISLDALRTSWQHSLMWLLISLLYFLLLFILQKQNLGEDSP